MRARARVRVRVRVIVGACSPMKERKMNLTASVLSIASVVRTCHGGGGDKQGTGWRAHLTRTLALALILTLTLT